MNAVLKTAQSPALEIVVTKLRSIAGHDGPCIEAALTVNGHALGVFDGGNGGGYEYHEAKKYGTAPTPAQTAAMKEALRLLREAAKAEGTHPVTFGNETHELPTTIDNLVSRAFDRYEVSRQLTRLLKKKVVFYRPGIEKPGEVRVVTATEDEKPKLAAIIREKNPSALILNEMDYEAALDLFMGKVEEKVAS